MPAEFRILQSDEGEDAPDGGSARPGYSATLRGSAQHGGLTRPYSQPQLSFPQDRDFDPDPSSTWISDEYSERSPLFGPPLDQEKRTPSDNYRIVWLVFYMLGMCTLLPWNFFIAVNDYWNFKFRDISGNSTHTQLQKDFTSYLAIASNVPNATFVLLNVFYGRSFKLNTRIIGALSLMSTLFIGVILMARIDSDDWQDWFLYSTLIIVVFLNVCTAIFQGGIIGVAGKFPPHYMGGMMSGQALGGIFPALVNILVIGVQVKPADVGFYCFLVAFLFVLVTLAAYCAVQTTQYFKHYAGTLARDGDTSSLLSSSYREVFFRSWKYQFSIFLNFCVTLTVFPSVTVLVTSQFSDDESNVFSTVYFTPVACFLLFNCGDYFGRILASHIRLPGTSRMGQNVVLGLTILRIGFIPLFMFCNAAPGVRNLPVYFDKDADYYALMIIFSLSNGYIGNLCMMMGPKTVERETDQECVASMLVSVLVLGIGIGSFLSYPIVHHL